MYLRRFSILMTMIGRGHGSLAYWRFPFSLPFKTMAKKKINAKGGKMIKLEGKGI
jgi:hypothetical protein